MLKFTVGNAKLDGFTIIFDLPAGHSCPFANICLSKAERVTGYIKDGPNTEFRCFSASSEARSPQLRDKRWNNFDKLRKLKTAQEMKDLIISSMIAYRVDNAPKYRIHTGGDFYSQTYFDAWIEVAKAYPKSIFYAYTKSIPYWVNRLGQIPSNFRLNASIGGKHDKLAFDNKLKYAKVVYSEQEAEELGLDIDHDDSLAYSKSKRPFALLLHGTQPAQSDASRAWERLKKEGIGGYSRKLKIAA